MFSFWILGLITLVCIIIIVGGLTRLTDSGLSITKWEIFRGILPPLNSMQWEKYFSEYKSIPQYIYLNSTMTLQEFKIIFFWEYFHRILGRVIGLFFFIPFIFFILKRQINKYLRTRLILISLLILFQGFMGWYMVESGLTDNLSVSHYRLSFHLLTAFLILSVLIWIFMNHYFQKNKNFFQVKSKFIFLIFLIFLQIVVGALVSGLDAGKIYQTWPLMNQSYFPTDNFLINLFNFSDPGFVQFLHRNVAYIICAMSFYVGFFIYKNKIIALYNSYLLFLLFIVVQIFLGIFVLYSNVNIYFASLHQISSIFLITTSLNLYFRSIKTS